MARRTLLVIAAILIAAIGTALIWYYVRGADERARGDQVSTTVYVPTVALAAGAASQAAVLSSVPTAFQVRGVPSDALGPADLPAIKGKVLLVPVAAGQALTRSMFGEPGSVASATGLARDKLAIEISLADPNRAAGLLHAGSEVAIFATSTSGTTPDVAAGGAGQGGATPGKQTWLLMKQVKVLSGSAAASSVPPSATTGVPTANIVLEVDQAQAQKIILTQAGDKSTVLWFALRGSQDLQLDGKTIITGQKLSEVTP